MNDGNLAMWRVTDGMEGDRFHLRWEKRFECGNFFVVFYGWLARVT